MHRTIVFLGLVTSAFAGVTLDALVNAAGNLSVAIQQQLATVQRDPVPADFARSTLAYAQAKTAYFTALREEMPELMNIATGKESRPLSLDKFAAAFSVAGEKQEMVADQKTMMFLKRFSPNPNVEKARQEFESAQKVEEQFDKDFDWQDFTLLRNSPLGGVPAFNSPLI